ATAALLMSALVPASAEDSESKTAPPGSADFCHGNSILPKLAASDPQTYQHLDSEAKSTENGQAVFWKIEKPGVDPSYLLGTVHLTDPRVTTLSAAVLDALGESKTVLLETADFSPAAITAAMAQARQSAIFTDGQTLERLLVASDYEKVRDTID